MKRYHLLGLTVLGLALWLPATASAQGRVKAPQRIHSDSKFRNDYDVGRPQRPFGKPKSFRDDRRRHHHHHRPHHGHPFPKVFRPPVILFGRPSPIFYPTSSHYLGPIYYRTSQGITIPVTFISFPSFYHFP